MKTEDFLYPILMIVFVFTVVLNGCDHVLLSLLDDDEKALRERVNKLELRVYRIELKTKTGGEVANETRD